MNSGANKQLNSINEIRAHEMKHIDAMANIWNFQMEPQMFCLQRLMLMYMNVQIESVASNKR